VVALALLIGFSVSTWMFFRERAALQEQMRLREVADSALANELNLRLEAEDRERITQAAFLIGEENLQAADELVDAVRTIEPSLETEAVLRRLGVWHALQNDWDRAAARFKQLLVADQQDKSENITTDLLMAGPIQIERGDLQGYERFRLAAIERFAGTSNPIDAERTVKISLLRPADESVMNDLKPLARLAAETFEKDEVNAGTYTVMAAWRCMSLSLMAYREGYYPTAKEWGRKSLSYQQNNPARDATVHIIRAMASHQLEEWAEARSELVEGRRLIEAEFTAGLEPGNGAEGFWFDWLFARVLLREAERLIEPLPTAN